jgi:similar to stage IV sporulation protein
MSLFVGYYIYSTAKANATAVYNACLHYGIQMVWQKEDETMLYVKIAKIDAHTLDSVLEMKQIPYEKSELKGVLGYLKTLWKHPGVLVGVVLSLLLYIWLGGMVWEVRIFCSSDIDEDVVLGYLSDCGLREGTRLSSLDPDSVTASYLLADSSIAFMAVHKKGVVVEVELVPKDEGEDGAPKIPLCNIVAERDALITDMTVYSGKAVVKIGDTVAKGDLLVSGIITDIGGTRLVGARGEVIGILTESGHIELPMSNEQKLVRRGELMGVDIRAFGIPLSFGEKENTIATKKQVYLFGTVRLPIAITCYHHLEEETKTVTYTEKMAEGILRANVEQKVRELVGTGNLLSFDSTFAVDGETFVMHYEVEYEGNIAKALAFATDN